MPDQRRGLAPACFLFEFGNGDKFVFDIGTGSMRGINALMSPSEFLTRILVRHLYRRDHRWGGSGRALDRWVDRHASGTA